MDDARASQLAAEARCTRCRVTILDEGSAPGLMYGSARVPLTGRTMAFSLCGKCALQLWEFMSPVLVHSNDWQQKKTLILQGWS